jgi:hypothetical protein
MAIEPGETILRLSGINKLNQQIINKAVSTKSATTKH